ncbi:hypothetical protein EN780_36620, partial [Mesorhizobium sp. M4B.F.Ca.ET.089.01.1.1]
MILGGRRIVDIKLEIVVERFLRDEFGSIVIGIGDVSGLGRRFGSHRLVDRRVIDLEFVLKSPQIGIVSGIGGLGGGRHLIGFSRLFGLRFEIRVDIGHRLVEMTGKVLLGDRLVGSRLHRRCIFGNGRRGMILRWAMPVERQLVLERQRNRMFEIVIESGFGHWRGSFDEVVVGRLHRLIAAREFAIERRGKLVVHRQIVIERRDV